MYMEKRTYEIIFNDEVIGAVLFKEDIDLEGKSLNPHFYREEDYKEEDYDEIKDIVIFLNDDKREVQNAIGEFHKRIRENKFQYEIEIDQLKKRAEQLNRENIELLSRNITLEKEIREGIKQEIKPQSIMIGGVEYKKTPE